MKPLYADDAVQVFHCDHVALAEHVRSLGGCDAVIVDAPYSDKTHAGHDGAVDRARFRPEDERRLRTDKRTGAVYAVGVNRRREIGYDHWRTEDVRAFVETWEPLCRGWFVSLTDDVLFPQWRTFLALADRQTFQDIPAIVRGMTVRLVGDGPSSWAIHCAVARPRSKAFSTWGTLDGGYVGPSEPQPCVGGKPLWLMRALVRDYTRPGDLVVDPCGGAGTTALACRLEGRRCITGDAMLEHAELAAERLRPLPTQARKGTLALDFGGRR